MMILKLKQKQFIQKRSKQIVQQRKIKRKLL